MGVLMIRLILCAAALVAPMPVAAQEMVTIAAPATDNVLRAGAKIPVRTLVELTTVKKALKVGDRINIETAEPIMEGSNVVIPAGTPGIAELTSVRNKGMWGKSGFIEGRVLYLRLAGRQIRMTGAFNDKGVTGTAAVVGAIALVPVVGFFTTGTSANIPQGSILQAFLDEDIPFSVGPAAPVPAVVATPAAPAAPTVMPAVVKTTTAAASGAGASMVDASLEIKATPQ